MNERNGNPHVTTHNRISAVLVTYNEENKIESALDSVSWVDEIIVVDLGSTDKTVELCKKYTSGIYFHSWEPFADPVRNYAASLSSSEWILFLDADECVTPELAQSIRRIVRDDWPADAFSFEFLHIRFGTVLWNSEALSSSLVPRLFRREIVQWPESVHQVPSFDGLRSRGLRGAQFGFIRHNTWPYVDDVIDRYSRYTKREASDRFRCGERYTTSRALYSSAKEFLSIFIQQGTYRDGIPGFFYASSMAMYRFLVWMHLWECDEPKASQDRAITGLGRSLSIAIFPISILLTKSRRLSQFFRKTCKGWRVPNTDGDVQ